MIPTGAPLTPALWADWQLQHQQGLATHRHTGGAQGGALPGAAFDPQSTLTVQELHLTGTLRLRGKTLEELAQAAALAAFQDLSTEEQARLQAEGLAIEGDLRVGDTLRCQGSVQVQGPLVQGGQPLQILPLIGPRSLTLGPQGALTPIVQKEGVRYAQLRLTFETGRDTLFVAWCEGGAVPWVLRGAGLESGLVNCTLKPGGYELFARSAPNSPPIASFDGVLHVLLLPG